MKTINSKGKNQLLIELDMGADPAEVGVAGEYSLYDTLFLLLEAVALISTGLIDSGEMTPEEVGKKINNQLLLAIQDYKYLGRDKK